MKIKYKASVIMTLFGIAILLIISLVYEFHSRKIVVDRELNRLESISKEVSLNINSNLFDDVSIAQTISTAPVLRNALKDSNTEFELLSTQEQEDKINTLNERWMETDNISDEFIQQRMTNSVAEYLKYQKIIIPGKYGEIFLTNRYGAMIATTSKLKTLSHANKYWWQAAYDEGKGRIFFDDRGYDTSANDYVIGLVIPIMDNNELIGLLKCNINIMSLLDDVVHTYSERNSGYMHIVRTSGLIISDNDITPLSISINQTIINHLNQECCGNFILSEKKQETLVAYSPIIITMGVDNIDFGGSYESLAHRQGNIGEGWHVVLSLDKKIALEAAHETTHIIIITGIVMTIIASLFTMLISTIAVKDILKVSSTAKELGKGNLGVRSNISSNDEINTLSHNLNNMAENLQNTMAKRDELLTEIDKRKIVEEKLLIISTIDELTGAYNRRAFNDNLKLNILHAKKNREPLSMLMLDIDFFKNLNDSNGHDVGDLILVALVSILAKSTRKKDTIARWGGDEFTVMLPNTGQDEAKLLAQRVINEVSSFNFSNNIRVTISVGITELLSSDYSNSFIKRSDQALYKAKEGGKNRAIFL
jgi:diguanylate cyclase (GGDEF)-like protein